MKRPHTPLIVALCAGLVSLSALLIGLSIHAEGQQRECNETQQTAEPAPKLGRVQHWKATFYAEPYCGRKTANGDTFDCQRMTAAHRTLPLGTKLHLQRGDRTVIVTCNDRGPWDKDPKTGLYRKDLDLSAAAFAALSPSMAGGEGLPVVVRRVLP